LKHQYFGDVNDYRKYGLLRCISEATRLRLGVLWLLTANDDGPDGKLRSYLDEPAKWQHRDPVLCDSLTQLCSPGVERSVDLASQWDLLPGAVYFNQNVPDSANRRREVFEAATAKMVDCQVLFLDPDNGIEVKSVPFGARRSSKYVYWRELASLFENGHSLIVYQHYRRVDRRSFETSLIDQFRSWLGAPEVAVFSTARVAFILALQAVHAAALPSITALVEARWAGQIRHVRGDGG
jgi:hypothetical protein